MHRILQRTESEIELRPYGHASRVAWWMLLIGTAIALPLVGVLLVSHTEGVSVVLTLYCALLLVALLGALIGWTRIRVHWGSGTLRIQRTPFPVLGKRRHGVPLAEISAVKIKSESRHSGKGQSYRVWVVDLFHGQRPKFGALPNHLKHWVRVPADGDEALAWQIAEHLSKNLALPVLDQDGIPIERHPDQLNHTLGSVLVAQGKVPGEPGPIPEGLKAHADPQRLVIEWSVWRLGNSVTSVVLVLSLAGFAIAALFSETPLLSILFFSFAFAFIWAFPSTLNTHGRHRLSIDDFAAHLELGLQRKTKRVPAKTMAKEELESLRIDRANRTLTLVADDMTISCPMTIEQAQWSKLRIAQFAYEQSLRLQGK